LLAGLFLLVSPAVSFAGCGGTEISVPSHRVAGQLPPLAIGDSTMLLSIPALAAAGFEVNARGCRQFFQANQLLAQLRAARQLPHIVVIALGADGSVAATDIDSALSILGPNRLLVLVTPRQLGGSSGQNAVTEHQQARLHPKQILLLDWVADSAGHPNWFQPDGLHLTYPGVYALNALIEHVYPYAYIVPGC